MQWLRDNLGFIAAAPEVEALAASVEDNGGCYVVPAFSGLFAPRWRTDARGVIAGLTGYVTKAHIARAALEAVAWQVVEVVDAMAADRGAPLTLLKVDGGMTANALLMQFQAGRFGRRGRSVCHRRDHLPGRRLRRRPGGGVLAGSGDPSIPLAGGRALVAGDERRDEGRAARALG